MTMESLEELLVRIPHTEFSASAYETVFYIEQSYSNKYKHHYNCLLCNEHKMSGDRIQTHICGSAHQQKVDRLNVSINDGLSMQRLLHSPQMQSAMDRSEILGSPAWRNTVRAELFRCLTVKPTPGLDRNQLLAPALQLLCEFEHLELLALLKLAVWKAQCLQQMRAVHIDFFAIEQWRVSGWKTLKKEYQNNNAMTIIASLVRPILWRFSGVESQ
jgi:hypothetical protein